MSESSSHPKLETPGLLTVLLVSFASLVTLLTIFELVLRIALPPPMDSPMRAQAAIMEFDVDLWWRLRRNAEIPRKRVRMQTNAFGMRSAPASRTKAPGTFRILSLGESTAFGWRVDQKAVYASLLERCLRGRGASGQVEVLNAATPGWSLVQSYEYLRREGIEFAPDAVLIYHGMSDFLPVHRAMKRAGVEPGAPLSDLKMMEQTRARSRSLGAFLLRHSRLARWALHLFAGGGAEGSVVDLARAEVAAPGERRLSEEERLRVLSQLLELVREHDTELIVLVPPYLDLTEHRAALLAFAASSGVPAIDLEPAVEQLGRPRRELFFDKAHAGPELHRAFANQICQALADRL